MYGYLEAVRCPVHLPGSVIAGGAACFSYAGDMCQAESEKAGSIVFVCHLEGESVALGFV